MTNLCIVVRIRSLLPSERERQVPICIAVQGSQIILSDLKESVSYVKSSRSVADNRKRRRYFSFDHVFSSCSTTEDELDRFQQHTHNVLGTGAVQSFLDGYNVSIFAYGTTGTGKTFTIFGTEVTLNEMNARNKQDIQRNLYISIVEIYKEKVYDLLVTQTKPNDRIALRMREHPQNGPYVDGLNKVPLRDAATVKWAIDLAGANRTQAENNVHAHSSRSHIICTIYYDEVITKSDWSRDIHSKLQLIDLAGSEKLRVSLNAKRFEEGKNINKSLSSLSNVITKLAERSFMNSFDGINTHSLNENGNVNLNKYGTRSSCYTGSINNTSIPGNDVRSTSTSTRSSHQSLNSPCTPVVHIPYRNSKLTWLLSDSLGGNTKTTMIATISPCFDQYNETLNTLRYAQQAKMIVNQPVVNEDASAVYIRKLLEEISSLKQRLHESRSHMTTELPRDICHSSHRPPERRRRVNSESDVSGSDVQVFNRLMLRENSKHTQYSSEMDSQREAVDLPRAGKPCTEVMLGFPSEVPQTLPSSQGPVLSSRYYSRVCHDTMTRNWSPSPCSKVSSHNQRPCLMDSEALGKSNTLVRKSVDRKAKGEDASWSEERQSLDEKTENIPISQKRKKRNWKCFTLKTEQELPVPVGSAVSMAQLESDEHLLEGHNSSPQPDVEIQQLILDTIRHLSCFYFKPTLETRLLDSTRSLCIRLLECLTDRRGLSQETLGVNTVIVRLTRLLECFDEALVTRNPLEKQPLIISEVKQFTFDLRCLYDNHEKNMLQTALEQLYKPKEWVTTTKVVYVDTVIQRIMSIIERIWYIERLPVTSEVYAKLSEEEMLLVKERMVKAYRGHKVSSSTLTLTNTEAMVAQYLMLARLNKHNVERTELEKQADLNFFNQCNGISRQKAGEEQVVASTITCSVTDVDQTVPVTRSVGRENGYELVDNHAVTGRSIDQVCCEKQTLVVDGKQDYFQGKTETAQISAPSTESSSHPPEDMVCVDPVALEDAVSYLQSKYTENVGSLSGLNCNRSHILTCLSSVVTGQCVTEDTQAIMIPRQTPDRLKSFLTSQDDTYAGLLCSHLANTPSQLQGPTPHPTLMGAETQGDHKLSLFSDKRPGFESNTSYTGTDHPETVHESDTLHTQLKHSLCDVLTIPGTTSSVYDISENVNSQSSSSVITTASKPSPCSQTSSGQHNNDFVCAANSDRLSENDSAMSATPIHSPLDKNLGFSLVVASLNCLRLLNMALSSERQLFDLELKLTQCSLHEVYHRYGRQLTRCEDFQQHWYKFIDSSTASEKTRRKIFGRIDWSLIEWTVNKVEELPNYQEMIASDSRTLFQLLDGHETDALLSNPEMFADILCTQILSRYTVSSHISLVALSKSLNIISRLLHTPNTSFTLSDDEYTGLKQLMGYGEELMSEDLPYFDLVELVVWKILQWWSSSLRTASDASQESQGSQLALTLLFCVLRAQSKDSLTSSLLCIEAHCIMAIGTFASTGMVEVKRSLLNEWMSPLESLLREFFDTTSLVSVQDLLRSTTRILKVNSSEEVDYQELRRSIQSLKNSTFYLEDRLPVQRYNALVSTLDIFNDFICPERACDRSLNPEMLRAVALHTIQILSLPTHEGVDERFKLYIHGLQLKTTLWCAGWRENASGGLLLNQNECATLRACIKLFCENKFSLLATDVWLRDSLNLGCFSTSGWYMDKPTCLRLMELAKEVVLCVKNDLNIDGEQETSQTATLLERITIFDTIFVKHLSLHACDILKRDRVISSLSRQRSREASGVQSNNNDIARLRSFVIHDELQDAVTLDISEQVIALVQLKFLRSRLTDAWCRDYPMPFTETFLFVVILRQLLYRQEFACYLESPSTRHLTTTVFFQLASDTRQSFPQSLNALMVTDIFNLSDLLIDELRRLTIERSLNLVTYGNCPMTSRDYWREMFAVVVALMLTVPEKSRRECCRQYFNKISSRLFRSMPLKRKNEEYYRSSIQEFLTYVQTKEVEGNYENNRELSLMDLLLKRRQLAMAAGHEEVRTPDQAWRLMHQILQLESWMELTDTSCPTICPDDVKGHLVCIMVSKSTECPYYLDTFDRECLQRLVERVSRLLTSEVNKFTQSALVILADCDASNAHVHGERMDTQKQSASTPPARVWSELTKALSLIVIAKPNLSVTDVGEITQLLVNLHSSAHSSAPPTDTEVKFIRHLLESIDLESQALPEENSSTTTCLIALRLIYNAKAKLTAMERNLMEVKPNDLLVVYSGVYSIVNTAGIWINLTKQQQYEANEILLLTLECFLSEKVITDVTQYSNFLNFMKHLEPIFEMESEKLLKVAFENWLAPDQIGSSHLNALGDTASLVTAERKIDDVTSDILAFCLERKLQTRTVPLLKLSQLLSILNVLEQFTERRQSQSILASTIPSRAMVADMLHFIQSDKLSATTEEECEAIEDIALRDLTVFAYLKNVIDGTPLWSEEATLLSACILTMLDSTMASLDKTTYSTCYKLAESLRKTMHFLSTETVVLDSVSLSNLKLLSAAYESIAHQTARRYFSEVIRLAPLFNTDQCDHLRRLTAYICMLAITGELDFRDTGEDIKTIWEEASCEEVDLVPYLEKAKALVQQIQGERQPSSTIGNSLSLKETPTSKLLLIKHEMELLLAQLEANQWAIHYQSGLHFFRILRLCQDLLKELEPNRPDKLGLVSHLNRFICQSLLCILTQRNFVLNKRAKSLLINITEKLSLDSLVCSDEALPAGMSESTGEGGLNTSKLQVILNSDFRNHLSPVHAALLFTHGLTVKGQMEESTTLDVVQNELLLNSRRSETARKVADSSAQATFLLLSSLHELETTVGAVRKRCLSEKTLDLKDAVRLVQCLTILTNSRNECKQFASRDGDEHAWLSSLCEAELNSTRFELLSLLISVADRGVKEQPAEFKLTTKRLHYLQELYRFWQPRVLLHAQRQKTTIIRKLSASAECDLTADMTTAMLSTALKLTILNGQPISPHDAWVCASVLQQLLNEPGDEYVNISPAQRDTLKSAMLPSRTSSSNLTSFNDCDLMVALSHLVKFSQTLHGEQNTESPLGRHLSSLNVASATASLTTILQWIKNASLKFDWLDGAKKLEHSMRITTAYGESYWIDASERKIIADMLGDVTLHARTWLTGELDTYSSQSQNLVDGVDSQVTLDVSTSRRQHLIYLLQCSLVLSGPLPTSLFTSVLSLHEQLTSLQTITLSVHQNQLLQDLKVWLHGQTSHNPPCDLVQSHQYVAAILQCLKPTENSMVELGLDQIRKAMVVSTLLDHLTKYNCRLPSNAVILHTALIHGLLQHYQHRNMRCADFLSWSDSEVMQCLQELNDPSISDHNHQVVAQNRLLFNLFKQVYVNAIEGDFQACSSFLYAASYLMSNSRSEEIIHHEELTGCELSSTIPEENMVPRVIQKVRSGLQAGVSDLNSTIELLDSVNLLCFLGTDHKLHSKEVAILQNYVTLLQNSIDGQCYAPDRQLNLNSIDFSALRHLLDELDVENRSYRSVEVVSERPLGFIHSSSGSTIQNTITPSNIDQLQSMSVFSTDPQQADPLTPTKHDMANRRIKSSENNPKKVSQLDKRLRSIPVSMQLKASQNSPDQQSHVPAADVDCERLRTGQKTGFSTSHIVSQQQKPQPDLKDPQQVDPLTPTKHDMTNRRIKSSENNPKKVSQLDKRQRSIPVSMQLKASQNSPDQQSHVPAADVDCERLRTGLELWLNASTTGRFYFDSSQAEQLSEALLLVRENAPKEDLQFVDELIRKLSSARVTCEAVEITGSHYMAQAITELLQESQLVQKPANLNEKHLSPVVTPRAGQSQQQQPQPDLNDHLYLVWGTSRFHQPQQDRHKTSFSTSHIVSQQQKLQPDLKDHLHIVSGTSKSHQLQQDRQATGFSTNHIVCQQQPQQPQQQPDVQSTFTDSYRLTALEGEATAAEQATLADPVYQPNTAGESLEMFDTADVFGCRSMNRLYEELLVTNSVDRRPALDFNERYLESYITRVSDRIDSLLNSLDNFENMPLTPDVQVIKAEQLAEVCALRDEVVSLRKQLIGIVSPSQSTRQTQQPQNILTDSMHELHKQQQRVAMQPIPNHDKLTSLNTDSHQGRLVFKARGSQILPRTDRKYQSSDCLKPNGFSATDPVLQKPIGTESMDLLLDTGVFNRISSLDRLHELIEIRRAVVAGSREELYRLGVYSSLPPSLKRSALHPQTTQTPTTSRETPRSELWNRLLEKQRSHAQHLMGRANYEHNQSYRVVAALQQQIQELERHVASEETT